MASGVVVSSVYGDPMQSSEGLSYDEKSRIQARIIPGDRMLSYHKAHTVKRAGSMRSVAHRCFGAGFVNPGFFSLYLILIFIPNTISENMILSYSKKYDDICHQWPPP